MPVRMQAVSCASEEMLFHVCFIFKVVSKFFVNSWYAVA